MRSPQKYFIKCEILLYTLFFDVPCTVYYKAAYVIYKNPVLQKKYKNNIDSFEY